MTSNDNCGTDFIMGGFRYIELKRDEKSGAQLWSATSVYGDVNCPSNGFNVTLKNYLHFPFPHDGLHNFEFRKDQLKEAELLFEALTKASAANRTGLGRGYVQDLRRIEATKPIVLPIC